VDVNLQRSVDRAIALFNTPHEYDKYVSIKIKPLRGGCCCFHCWPETWAVINEHIRPCGPIEDEGDVLVRKDNYEFVLECHESGPEIIIYLGVTTAFLALAKTIVDLITALLKARQKEHKASLKYKITVMSYRGVLEEVELDLPLSDEVRKQLEERIGGSLESRRATVLDVGVDD
jgi:hypothetical protein